jgi:hypothetical protein
MNENDYNSGHWTDVCLGELHPQHFCCICTQILNDPRVARDGSRLFLA